MPNIVEDEVVVAALKSLVQNKRISALCLEQHEKGLFPDYAAIKARILQEDESLPIDKIGEQKYGFTTMHMPSPSTTSYYTAPTQLQSFGNTHVPLPKESKSIGGQSYPKWAEIEKKIKANFTARRQKQKETELAQVKEALPIGRSNVKKDDSEHESAPVKRAESRSIYSESIKCKEASIIEKGHGKHSKATILDFSKVNGTYFLPYEFRAREIDELQGQEQVAEQSSADKHLQCNDARNQEKDDEEALGSHPKMKQDIVQVTPPSCSPNIFEEVCLASNLPIFRFGQNFIVDASIRKILISNFERPMKKGNLLVSNKVVIEHIGQPITPFIKTDSDLLLQRKLSPLLYVKFISV